eukprot:GEMP01017718.1.p1 GENE.GEMP01017718.1~~GEMP01017718.1.p1  ORF type:complete len:687 (+),score=146.55 GEMP01017718.1:103-2163(+)
MKRARPSDSDCEEPIVFGVPPPSSERLILRPGNTSRPLWVDGGGFIVLEAFHEFAPQAQEFLVQVAEPKARPSKLHEFQITLFSLYAAVTAGLTVNEILRVLDMFSKTNLSESLAIWIRKHGEMIGKVRMALRDGRYFVESSDRGLLERLFANTNIKLAALTESLRGRKFEVNPVRIETVKEEAHGMEVPLVEEYDFRSDPQLPELHITIRTTTNVRPYQSRALSKVFSTGMARSGVIVLPCGAGKTLVGILAACTVKKRVLVLTTTAVAVDQWRRQFLQFTHLSPRDIYSLTSDSKNALGDVEERGCVLVSTYSMLGYSGKRSSSTQYVLNQVRNLTWGLLIVDEVQVMPAKTFRTVATNVKAQCKLGLTATLVREDDLVKDLQWLIGPKLYEANWQQLQDEGYLAKVQCVEVWCGMTRQFYREYLRAKDQGDFALQRSLFTCNPTKLQVCEYLIRFHENRGDKVIVFSDNVIILEDFARRIKRHFICGKVEMNERMQILRAFQTRNDCNTIFLSKVGDNAIDLPAANIVIQISSHFGSRRQEAQRLGRILRPKPKSVGILESDSGGANAFFYSLVSQSTQEMFFSSKRQQFLVEQGYAYRVVRDMTKNLGAKAASLVYADANAEKEVLRMCLETSNKYDLSDDDVALFADINPKEENDAQPDEQCVSFADLSRGSGTVLNIKQE